MSGPVKCDIKTENMNERTVHELPIGCDYSVFSDRMCTGSNKSASCRDAETENVVIFPSGVHRRLPELMTQPRAGKQFLAAKEWRVLL